MNNKLFYLSIIELVISLVIGVLVLFLVYRFFMQWFRRRYNFNDDSLAINVLVSAILFSTAYLLSGCLVPINTSFKTLQGMNLDRGMFIWESVKYAALFLAIGLIISLLSNYITLLFYNSITKKVDELEEIANGKISYAILMSALLISMTLFIRDAYINIIESLIPYPDLPFMPR